MRGGVLRHHGGTAFRACDNAVLPRMDEMPGENVGPGACGWVHRSIDLLGCGSVGSWDNDCYLVGLRTSLRSGCGSLPITRPRRPPFRTPKLSCCLYLRRPRCTRACPFPACIAYGAGGSRVGSGPALEHRNRPHPSGGGDVISRPYAFWTSKNTRIARGQRRVPSVRFRGRPAVFPPKVHRQRITVGGHRG
jgi:hypothetical protein